MSNKRDLKAYVRYDGSGNIVPGSVILQRNKPKVGHWEEINTYECCNPTTTTTTTEAVPVPYCATYNIVLDRGTGVLFYDDCDGTPRGPFNYSAPVDDYFCCLTGSISYEGDGSISMYQSGCRTTTTTTTTSAPIYTRIRSIASYALSANACADEFTNTTYIYSSIEAIPDFLGTTLYSDNLLTTPFVGDSNYYLLTTGTEGFYYAVKINASGVVLDIVMC